MKTLIVFLLYFLTTLNIARADCADFILGSDITTYECGSPGAFTSSSFPQMPAGGRFIILNGEISIVDTCGGSAPYHLMTLTIDTPQGATKKIMDIQWTPSTKTMAFSSEGQSGVVTTWTETLQTQPSAQWFAFSAIVDMPFSFGSALWTKYGTNTNFNGLPTVSYGSDWTIDSNPKLTICSDINGARSFKCQARSVKAWYPEIFSSYYITLAEGTYGTLAARYNLQQTSGYAVTDSANSLGTAYLGASQDSVEDTNTANMPTWVPAIDPATSLPTQDTGLKFTQGTEYLTIPTFSLAETILSPAYVFTVKIWVKLSGAQSSDGYVFRYSKSDLSKDYFAVKVIAATNQLSLIMSDKTVTSTGKLSTTNWNSILVSFDVITWYTLPSTSPGRVLYNLILNNVNDVTSTVSTTPPYTSDNANIVRIGGPPTVTGIISGVDIYNPGSGWYNEAPCQASTCQRDLGMESPPVCILPICHASCATCFNELETGCLTCAANYGFYQSKCIPMTCPTGQYLDGTYTCQNCIQNCDKCHDDTTCDTCKNGFVYQSSQCVVPSPSSASASASGSGSGASSGSTDDSGKMAGIIAGSVVGGVVLIAVGGYIFIIKVLKAPKARTMYSRASSVQTPTSSKGQTIEIGPSMGAPDSPGI